MKRLLILALLINVNVYASESATTAKEYKKLISVLRYPKSSLEDVLETISTYRCDKQYNMLLNGLGATELRVSTELKQGIRDELSRIRQTCIYFKKGKKK